MRKVNFEPGGIYHIYNRGVEKRNIFVDQRDKWRFLQILALFNDNGSQVNVLWSLERDEGANMKTLKDYLSDKGRDPLVKILADCLMDNHYHLLLEEVKEDGISDFMHKIGTGYTMYFNKKYNRSGSLFQGRYKAVKVEDDLYLKYLLVYINVINPAELKGVKLNEEEGIEKAMKVASDYDWSTNKEYLGKRESFVINKGILKDIFTDFEEYEEFVKMVLEEKKHTEIEELTLE